MGLALRRNYQTRRAAGFILQTIWAVFSDQDQRYQRIWDEIHQESVAEFEIIGGGTAKERQFLSGNRVLVANEKVLLLISVEKL